MAPALDTQEGHLEKWHPTGHPRGTKRNGTTMRWTHPGKTFPKTARQRDARLCWHQNTLMGAAC
eukprot:1159622-Pelagomonas_calceolata.AAC.14